jgi:hypothetical protein
MTLMGTVKNAIRNIAADGALTAARDALAQTEQRIVELDGERAQKLANADGDYLTEIAAIDAQILSQQAHATVHRDRIAAMAIRRAKQEREQREQERVAFVGELKKTVPRRHAAAARLDAALKEAAKAFEDLAAADEAIFKSWPEVMPPADRFSYLRAMRIEALSSTRKHRPLSAGLVCELINRGPFDFAAEVEKRGRELIEELEGLPGPADEVAA